MYMSIHKKNSRTEEVLCVYHRMRTYATSPTPDACACLAFFFQSWLFSFFSLPPVAPFIRPGRGAARSTVIDSTTKKRVCSKYKNIVVKV